MLRQHEEHVGRDRLLTSLEKQVTELQLSLQAAGSELLENQEQHRNAMSAAARNLVAHADSSGSVADLGKDVQNLTSELVVARQDLTALEQQRQSECECLHGQVEDSAEALAAARRDLDMARHRHNGDRMQIVALERQNSAFVEKLASLERQRTDDSKKLAATFEQQLQSERELLHGQINDAVEALTTARRDLDMVQPRHDSDTAKIAISERQNSGYLENIENLERQHNDDLENIAILKRQHNDDMERLASSEGQHSDYMESITVLERQCTDDSEKLAAFEQRHIESIAKIASLEQRAQAAVDDAARDHAQLLAVKLQELSAAQEASINRLTSEVALFEEQLGACRVERDAFKTRYEERCAGNNDRREREADLNAGLNAATAELDLLRVSEVTYSQLTQAL